MPEVCTASGDRAFLLHLTPLSTHVTVKLSYSNPTRLKRSLYLKVPSLLACRVPHRFGMAQSHRGTESDPESVMSESEDEFSMGDHDQYFEQNLPAANTKEFDDVFAMSDADECFAASLPVTKRACIGAVPFRFLHLPPEIRNRIYRQLLHVREFSHTLRKFCWPNIIVTCKQVHEESRGILYKENSATIQIVWMQMGRQPQVILNINGSDDIMSRAQRGHFSPIKWPKYLRQIEQIRFVCNLRAGNYLQRNLKHLSNVNRVFYQLRQFLQGSARTQKLRVEVRNGMGLGEEWLSKLLAPLRLYGPNTSFTFSEIPESLTQSIVTDAQVSDARGNFDIVQKYYELTRDAHLVVSAPPLVKCLRDRILPIEATLEKIQYDMSRFPCFVTIGWHKRFLKDLRDLEELMRKICPEAAGRGAEMVEESGEQRQVRARGYRDRGRNVHIVKQS